MIANHVVLRSALVLLVATGVASWLGPVDVADVQERWLGGYDGEDAALESGEEPDSLAGKMLVAAPGLDDAYFAGTRIYMLMHDEDGAVGVVVNRHHPRLGVSEGGPVGHEQVVVLVDDHAAPPGSLHVADGVSVLTDPGRLDDEMVLAHARIFVGYAGWGPGQLESELQRGVWSVQSATPADALDDPFAR